jgi:hypothetical protein
MIETGRLTFNSPASYSLQVLKGKLGVVGWGKLMLKYRGRIGLWLLLVVAFGCGPMNQKTTIDPSQKSICDPQVPSGSTGSSDPTGGEPVAFTGNKNYIVSISFVGVPGSSSSSSPTPGASPSPTSDDNYLLKIVSSPSLEPLSPTAQVLVQQIRPSDNPPRIYTDPLQRLDQWGWLVTAHFGRPSKYEIHVTITDGNLPAEERVFHVSLD